MLDNVYCQMESKCVWLLDVKPFEIVSVYKVDLKVIRLVGLIDFCSVHESIVTSCGWCRGLDIASLNVMV